MCVMRVVGELKPYPWARPDGFLPGWFSVTSSGKTTSCFGLAYPPWRVFPISSLTRPPFINPPPPPVDSMPEHISFANRLLASSHHFN